MDESLAAPASDLEVHRLLTGADAPALETIGVLKAKSAEHYFDEPAEAIRIASVAYRLGLELPQPAPALAKWTLANALLFANRYSEAVALFEQASADYLALHLDLEAARMGVGQVWGLAYAGRFADALAVADQIEPLLETAARTNPEDLRRLGSLFNNKGILFELIGSYEQALEAYDRRLAVARQLDQLPDIARTQHNRVLLFMKLNALEEALAASQEAEKGFEAAGLRADLGRLFLNRGLLMAAWERLDDAEDAFRRADARLTALDGMEQQRHAATVFGLLTRLQADKRVNWADCDALQTAQQALAVHGPVFQEALAWIGLGQCYLKLGGGAAAQSAFARALQLGEQGAGRRIRVLALHGLGLLAEKQARWEEAIGHFQAAIQQVEALRHDLHIESFRAGFLADKLVVYHDLADLLVHLDRYEQAYAITEQGRARVLAERLAFRLEEATMGQVTGKEGENALEEELRRTIRQMEDLQTSMRLGGGSGADELGFSPPHEQVLQMEALEDRVVQIVREIERATPRLASPGSGLHPVPFLPLLASDDAVLLHYYVSRGRVGVFVIDAAGSITHRSLTPIQPVAEASLGLRAAMERLLALARDFGPTTVGRFLPALLKDTQARLGELYHLLLYPVADLIRRHPQLVISPDGPLHEIPFHALYDGNAFVIERKAVSYTPSATILALCNQAIPAGSGALIVGYGGDYLPGVQAEVHAVVKHFANATVLIGENATSTHFLSQVGSHRHVHVASHARFRQDNVMLSALSLADRRLTFAEITRLRLQTDLVVLSGCETGQGRVLGTDVMSLANGFLGAGARSLLVSLWRVDDSTTVTFMDKLYRHLATETNRAEALRRAQLDLLSWGRESTDGNSMLAHPACWAPFVLLGSWLPSSTSLPTP